MMDIKSFDHRGTALVSITEAARAIGCAPQTLGIRLKSECLDSVLRPVRSAFSKRIYGIPLERLEAFLAKGGDHE